MTSDDEVKKQIKWLSRSGFNPVWRHDTVSDGQRKKRLVKGLFVCFKSINLFLSPTIYFICTFFQVTPELNASFTTPLTGYKETPRKFLADDNISEKATPRPDMITVGSAFDTRCWWGRPWLGPRQLTLIPTLKQTIPSLFSFHLNHYENRDTSCVTRGRGSNFMKIQKEVEWIIVTDLIILLFHNGAIVIRFWWL